MADTVKIFVEDTSGERFECEIPADFKLSKLAADFFEARNWPTRDGQGRNQRAVLELVDPENLDRTKRLNGEHTVEEAGLWDGAILRVFPESIAGAIDARERKRVLVIDHQEMQNLVDWNDKIKFETNTSYAPTIYKVFLECPGFIPGDSEEPKLSNNHTVKITLGPDYPRRAPRVSWETPIFHPNIHPKNKSVCLGVLMDRYLPGLGLVRLVTMLAEMVQYRNYDITGVLNKAAAEWAANPQNWEKIHDMGGYPFQGPIEEMFEMFNKEVLGTHKQLAIKFKKYNKKERIKFKTSS